MSISVILQSENNKNLFAISVCKQLVVIWFYGLIMENRRPSKDACFFSNVVLFMFSDMGKEKSR